MCPILADCPSGTNSPRKSYFGVLILVFISIIFALYKVISQRRRKIKRAEIFRARRDEHSTTVAGSTGLLLYGTIEAIGADNPDREANAIDLPGFRNKPFRVSLNLQNFSFKLFETNLVLDDISVKIDSAQITCIMGPSGAGKSTLLRSILGIVTNGKFSGKMYVNDHEEPLGLRKYKNIVGYVPQDDIIHRDLTVRENITFAARVSLPKDISKVRVKLIVKTIIDLIGLTHVADTVVGTEEDGGISGGERRRTSIAVAMVADPCLLIGDEITSGLDATTAQEILVALQSLASTGVNIILTLHQPRFEIFQLINTLILLAPGGFVCYHGPANLAIPYFQELGFEFYDNVSPADWLIDLVSGHVRRRGDKHFKINQLKQLWEKNKDTVSQAARLDQADYNDHQVEEDLQALLDEEEHATYSSSRRTGRRANDLLSPLSTSSLGMESLTRKTSSPSPPPPQPPHRRRGTSRGSPLSPLAITQNPTGEPEVRRSFEGIRSQSSLGDISIPSGTNIKQLNTRATRLKAEAGDRLRARRSSMSGRPDYINAGSSSGSSWRNENSSSPDSFGSSDSPLRPPLNESSSQASLLTNGSVPSISIGGSGGKNTSRTSNPPVPSLSIRKLRSSHIKTVRFKRGEFNFADIRYSGSPGFEGPFDRFSFVKMAKWQSFYRIRPNFFYQFSQFYSRSMIQMFRNWKLLVMYLGGVAIAAVFTGLVYNYNRASEILPAAFAMTLALGLSGVLLPTTTFRDRVVYWREAAAGINTLSFYLAKILSTIFPPLLLSPAVFLMIFYTLFQPRQTFLQLYLALLAAHWALFGIGHLISLLVKPSLAILGAATVVLISIIFSGNSPRLSDIRSLGPVAMFFADISFARWTFSLIVLQELETYQPAGTSPLAPDIPSEVDLILTDLDMSFDNIQEAYTALILMGTITHILTYFALRYNHRKNQS